METTDVVIRIKFPRAVPLSVVSFSAHAHIDAATKTTNAPARPVQGDEIIWGSLCLSPCVTTGCSKLRPYDERVYTRCLGEYFGRDSVDMVAHSVELPAVPQNPHGFLRVMHACFFVDSEKYCLAERFDLRRMLSLYDLLALVLAADYYMLPFVSTTFLARTARAWMSKTTLMKKQFGINPTKEEVTDAIQWITRAVSTHGENVEAIMDAFVDLPPPVETYPLVWNKSTLAIWDRGAESDLDMFLYRAASFSEPTAVWFVDGTDCFSLSARMDGTSVATDINGAKVSVTMLLFEAQENPTKEPGPFMQFDNYARPIGRICTERNREPVTKRFQVTYDNIWKNQTVPPGYVTGPLPEREPPPYTYFKMPHFVQGVDGKRFQLDLQYEGLGRTEHSYIVTIPVSDKLDVFESRILHFNDIHVVRLSSVTVCYHGYLHKEDDVLVPFDTNMTHGEIVTDPHYLEKGESVFAGFGSLRIYHDGYLPDEGDITLYAKSVASMNTVREFGNPLTRAQTHVTYETFVTGITGSIEPFVHTPSKRRRV